MEDQDGCDSCRRTGWYGRTSPSLCPWDSCSLRPGCSKTGQVLASEFHHPRLASQPCSIKHPDNAGKAPESPCSPNLPSSLTEDELDQGRDQVPCTRCQLHPSSPTGLHQVPLQKVSTALCQHQAIQPQLHSDRVQPDSS